MSLDRDGVGNSHQWTYKKGHSTELLLMKITETRLALENNYVVGVFFLDIRTAFDPIPPPFCSENFRVLV